MLGFDCFKLAPKEENVPKQNQEALHIIHERPTLWEYKLFAVLHRDAFANLERAQDVHLSRRTPSEVLSIESFEDSANMITVLMDRCRVFAENMKQAVSISSQDEERCFGAPGQAGDPIAIEALVNRVRSEMSVCSDGLRSFHALQVNASKPLVKETAQLFIRSMQSYLDGEFDRVVDTLRSMGANWLRELQCTNPRLICELKIAKPHFAFEPLIYATKEAFVYKPTNLATKLPSVQTKSVCVSFVDTETTGVEAHDEPISIGVLKYEVCTETGQIVREIGRYYGLRQPRVAISDGAFHVHGIRQEQVLGQKWDSIVLESLLDADMLVAHNADFDHRIVSKVIPTKRSSWFCTMKDFADLWGQRKWVSLDNLVLRYDLERGKAHQAMEDALVVSKLMQALLPPPAAGKPFLWEAIRRHFGLPTVEFDGRDMWVWGQYSKRDGRLLQLRVERYGLPVQWETCFSDDSAQEQSEDGCVEYPLEGYLSYRDAMAAKSELITRLTQLH